MFLSKYSLDSDKTMSSMFRTQCTPDFFAAEYYCLRNTNSWGTKDLASTCVTRHLAFGVFLTAI
jgi:hypothetical protein